MIVYVLNAIYDYAGEETVGVFEDSGDAVVAARKDYPIKNLDLYEAKSGELLFLCRKMGGMVAVEIQEYVIRPFTIQTKSVKNAKENG